MAKASRPGVEAQRVQILTAARALFGRRGIETTTVNDLIQEAGVSRATFYRCFPNLERVIETLYQEFSDHVLGRLASGLDAGMSEEGVAQLIARVIEDAQELGPFLTALFREEMRPGSDARKLRAVRVEAQVTAIRAWWTAQVLPTADDDVIRALVLLLQILGLEVAVGGMEASSARATAQFIVSSVIEKYLRLQPVSR